MAEINATQMRDALAWSTNKQEPEPSSNPFVWLWEAVEGDFNEDRSTAQILVDAGISMIPLVDQVCDVRDLIADCKKLVHDYKDTWAWVSLVLTLIGLFPSLGSLVKGVLKIFFAFVRRTGTGAAAKPVEEGMTWVVTFLRRREVQIFLNAKKVDEVFQWLATEVKSLQGRINVGALNAAFDRGIKVLEDLVKRVSIIPVVGAKAKGALEQIKKVRLLADEHLQQALKPVHDVVHTIIQRLERETMERQSGIVNASNVHFRGAIPEAQAVALMRKRKPSFISSTGDKFFRRADRDAYRPLVVEASSKLDALGNVRPASERFPNLTNQNIESFHTLAKHTIRGPARLYRILAPNSRGLGDCWITQEVFDRLQRSPDPKEAWRRHLGVWPDWNANGQFIIYDVKAGETLNAWRGPAASQKKETLKGHHLEGGWEQIILNVERGDARADTMRYYKVGPGKNSRLGKGMSQAEVDSLLHSMNPQQRALFFEKHTAVRAEINHPNISGPFETGWGYSEFDGAGLSERIGLPVLPGQITKLAR